MYKFLYIFEDDTFVLSNKEPSQDDLYSIAENYLTVINLVEQKKVTALNDLVEIKKEN